MQQHPAPEAIPTDGCDARPGGRGCAYDSCYKPAAADVVLFWQEVRKHGLSPGLKYKRLFTIAAGEQAGDWKLYVENISGMYVGISESADGDALWLLLVAPTKSMTKKEAIQEALNRAQ